VYYSFLQTDSPGWGMAPDFLVVLGKRFFAPMFSFYPGNIYSTEKLKPMRAIRSKAAVYFTWQY